MYENLEYAYHIQQRNLLAEKVDDLLAHRDKIILENEDRELDWLSFELLRVQIENIDLLLSRCQKDKTKHQKYIDKFMDQNE